jgi:hypothetical protein
MQATEHSMMPLFLHMFFAPWRRFGYVDERSVAGTSDRICRSPTLLRRFSYVEGYNEQLHREKNPLMALRARCLDCCCGVASEVRKCTAVNCPSWLFRMGINPFREKRGLTADQKAALAERLAKATA